MGRDPKSSLIKDFRSVHPVTILFLHILVKFNILNKILNVTTCKSCPLVRKSDFSNVMSKRLLRKICP